MKPQIFKSAPLMGRLNAVLDEDYMSCLSQDEAKENIMNHHQWSQRLRGHINPKLCIAVALATLPVAFMGQLTAQNNKPKLLGGKTDCLDCGAVKNINAQTLKLVVPQNSKLTGTITGPFRDVASQDISSRTLTLDAVSPTASLGYEALKDGIYKINLTAYSPDEEIYGVSLGKEETAEKNLIARLSEKSHVVQLVGTISGATIQGSTLKWGFLSAPTFQKPEKAVVEVSGDGLSMVGTMSGDYVDDSVANQPVVTKTVDANKDDNLVVIGKKYYANVLFFNQKREDFFGASLFDAKQRTIALTVVSDRNQKQIQLQGIAASEEGTIPVLGWGRAGSAAKAPKAPVKVATSKGECLDCSVGENVKAQTFAKNSGERNTDLPTLLSKRIETQAYAQTVPALTPAPGPTTGGQQIETIIVNGIIHYIIGLFEGQKRYQSCSVTWNNETQATNGEVVIPVAATQTVNACDAAQTPSKTYADGLFLNPKDGDEKAVYACPGGAAGPPDKPKYDDAKPFPIPVAKGVKNVTATWKHLAKPQKWKFIAQTVVGVSPNTHAGNPIIKDVIGTLYINEAGSSGGEPCPTPTPTSVPTPTPTPVPTPTPTRNPEDPAFNGTPAPQNPPTNGGTTPGAPPPAAQP